MQEKQKGGDKEQYDQLKNLRKSLPPFDNTTFNQYDKTLKHSRGLDVVDYKSTLCYEYEDFIFDGKPPSELEHKADGLVSWLESEELESQDEDDALVESAGPEISGNGYAAKDTSKDTAKDTSKGPRLGMCKRVCKDDYCDVVCAAEKDGKHFVKVFVGVVLPKEGSIGANEFSLCQEERCVEDAGEVSTFGGGTEDVEIAPQEVLDDKKFYIIKADVTSVMEKEGWSIQKTLKAKMNGSNLPSNLPDPVVIIKKIGKQNNQGKVIFPPKEKPKRYGKLQLS